MRPIRTLQFSPGGRGVGRRARRRTRLLERRLRLPAGGRDRARAARDVLLPHQADNAERAGAAAVLVVDRERERPVAATLGNPGLRIPALALGAPAGEGLAGRRATVPVSAVSEARQIDQRHRRDGSGGRAARGDGRRSPRLRARRPRPERQRKRRRSAAAHRRAPGRRGPAAAVRVLGRRGDRPRRLAEVRERAAARRAAADRRLREPRHGRHARQRARGLRRRPHDRAGAAPPPPPRHRRGAARGQLRPRVVRALRHPRRRHLHRPRRLLPPALRHAAQRRPRRARDSRRAPRRKR